MSYTPKHFRLPEGGVLRKDSAPGALPYVFSEAIAIAVNVALATHRPLLVSGDPGCGKSRLADAVATVKGWGLLSKTITSRTRLETLTAEVDQLRRLNDAQAGRLGGAAPDADPQAAATARRPDGYYLNPGIFWWAFDPDGARLRGLKEPEARLHQALLDYPGQRPEGKATGTVLLIDEIDKAEPDLPNDLLEPLDRRRFDLPDGYLAQHDDGPRSWVEAPPPDALRLLTIITTNGERELPPAFLRRCVQLPIPNPDEDELVKIARHHYPEGDADRIRAVARIVHQFRDPARKLQRRPPGTAELLDAVAACEELGIQVSDDPASVWSHIERAVLTKDQDLWQALRGRAG